MKAGHFQNTDGLVLCGGRSSRMGQDKSLLKYYNKPQRYHLYDILLPLCDQVFISCNQAQVSGIADEYPFIADDLALGDTGPMTALLSAFTMHPQENMLLTGCDYPFLSTAELEAFATHCMNTPAAFFNEDAGVYEPMLAWYPSESFSKLKAMHRAGQTSLQHFLKDNKAVKYYPQDKKSITSIDTYDDHLKAVNIIKP